jgi:hypothetical protein
MTRRVTIRFFLRFMREKEKTRVNDKDSRAEVRRESFREDQKKLFFSVKTDQMMLKKPPKKLSVSLVCDAYAQICRLI